jgi:hypothetical protein
MIKLALSSLKGLYEAARATRIGGALIGTPARALVTAGAVGFLATRGSSAAAEVSQYRQ